MHREAPTHLAEVIELDALLKERNRQDLESFLVAKAARLIERITGSTLLIEPPQIIREFGFAAEEPLRIIKKLYDRGFILSVPHVSQYVKYPDEPLLYVTSFGNRSSGVDFFNPSKALWRALGEYIERELWNNEDAWFRPNLLPGPKARFGAQAIDIRHLAGFSGTQKAKEPKLRIENDSEFGWIPVTSLATGETKRAPAQLFSSYYWCRERGQEPILRGAVTTGLASGQTLEDAVLRGALEVIERDAFMITYLNKISPPQLEPAHLASQDEQIAAILDSFKRSQLEPRILLLPTDFDVPVVCVATVDRTGKGPALAVGAKADFSLREAIIGALSESLAVRLHLKDKKGPLPENFPKNKINREERLEYWMDLRRLVHIEFFLKGPVIKSQLPSTPTLNSSLQLVRLASMLKQNECEMYCAEIFSEKLRKVTSLRTACVVSPQLHPMHLSESIPYLGSQRLSSVPKKLGYPAAKKLNEFPHPFP